MHTLILKIQIISSKQNKMKVCLYSHLLAFINTEGLLYTNWITGELTKHCVVHFPLTFSFKDLIYFPYLSYLKIMYSISIYLMLHLHFDKRFLSIYLLSLLKINQHPQYPHSNSVMLLPNFTPVLLFKSIHYGWFQIQERTDQRMNSSIPLSGFNMRTMF